MVGAEGVEALARASARGALPRLTELDLGNNDLDAGMAAFADACDDGVVMPRLEKLQLWTCRVGDAGVAAIAAALQGSQLKELNLASTPVGDAGATAIAAALRGSQLKRLDLDKKQMGDKVAIITGAGERAFSAGNDLKFQAKSGGGVSSPPTGFGGLTSRFDNHKPVIAAVNGVCAAI